MIRQTKLKIYELTVHSSGILHSGRGRKPNEHSTKSGYLTWNTLVESTSFSNPKPSARTSQRAKNTDTLWAQTTQTTGKPPMHWTPLKTPVMNQCKYWSRCLEELPAPCWAPMRTYYSLMAYLLWAWELHITPNPSHKWILYDRRIKWGTPN